MAKIGVFGGSFNPIHVGHLILAEIACSERGLDKVIFVPARIPPHKPHCKLAAAQDRFKMVEMAVADNDRFAVSSLEIEREGPSYTLLTVRELKEKLANQSSLFLLVGSDSVHEMPQWWRAQELVREVDMIALRRPGYPLDHVPMVEKTFGRAVVNRIRDSVLDAPLLEISSTQIRKRVKEGKTIRYLVPESVRQYILTHNLYGAG